MPLDGIAVPAVGRRYELQTQSGDRLVLVVHHSGCREVHVLAEGGDEPKCSLRLTDAEVRQIRSVLSSG
jgi:TrkA domain protein